MSTTLSKMQRIALGCLSVTALAGAFSIPSASAADYKYVQREHSQMNRGNSDYRESRVCRNLRRRIEWARSHGEYRLAYRLEREYRRECSRYRR